MSGAGPAVLALLLNTGGRYSPTTDGLDVRTTNGTPLGRYWHTAVWTGGEMLVWGGYNYNAGPPYYLNTGGRYIPSADTWTAVSSNDAPPSVTTLPATSVTACSATLNGTVNPNGNSTTAWFEWGTTTACSNSTVPETVTPGATDVQLTNQISSLLPLTTYHFRLRATNSVGADTGTDMSFITLAPPSTNANLSGLVLSSGPLTPAFGPAVTNYTAYVPNPTNSVIATPTSADANATIRVRVNGGGFSAVASGAASAPLALNVGTNFIDVAITAQDLVTSNTYRLTLPRADGPTAVATSPATNVINDTAALMGTVTPNGWPTTVWFEWGTVPMYWHQTPPVSVGSTTVPVSLHQHSDRPGRRSVLPLPGGGQQQPRGRARRRSPLLGAQGHSGRS